METGPHRKSLPKTEGGEGQRRWLVSFGSFWEVEPESSSLPSTLNLDMQTGGWRVGAVGTLPATH